MRPKAASEVWQKDVVCRKPASLWVLQQKCPSIYTESFK